MSIQQPLVLVVDDELAVREVVCEKLSHHSFKAISAANGKEAFKLIEEASPDLILLDLRLPDIDGMTICQQIRRKSRTQSRRSTTRSAVCTSSRSMIRPVKRGCRLPWR